MSGITDFIASHTKLVAKVVSVSFVLGVISLIIQSIDKKLSENSKKRFNRWIAGTLPKIRAWDLEGLYSRAKGHKVQHYCLYLLVVVLGSVMVSLIHKNWPGLLFVIPLGI